MQPTKNAVKDVFLFLQELGPPWAWSMFAFERSWGQAGRSILQTRYPEAGIMLSMRIRKIASMPIQTTSAQRQARQAVHTPQQTPVHPYQEATQNNVAPEVELGVWTSVPNYVNRQLGTVTVLLGGRHDKVILLVTLLCP